MKRLLILLFAGCFSLIAVADEDIQTAVFAGGCFWCMEPPFDKIDGVVSTTSGYTGGHVDNPSYDQVVRENTGHREAVQVRFRPEAVSYEKLLDVFWRNIDPLDDGGQFCDRGFSYTSAIYPVNEQQRSKAKASLDALNASGRFETKIVTEIRDADTFWEAERYHQDYYQKNPVRYRYYRYRCGRDDRLEALWGDDESLNLFEQ